MWLALLLLLVAPQALAADGDAVAGGAYASGPWDIQTYYLCDGDHTATDCDELDLHVQTAHGLPHHLEIELVSVGGCSGVPSVAVRGLTHPLGMPAVYADLTVAGTSAVETAFRHRHLDAVITNPADCVDLEVYVRLFYRRVR